MSTTLERKVAVQYSQGKKGHSHVMEYDMDGLNRCDTAKFLDTVESNQRFSVP